MSHLQYFDYKGFGQWAKENLLYSQAVRIGDIIECSGQGGWDRTTHAISSSTREQVAQTFENVDHAVKSAGGRGWEDVCKVRMYYLPLDRETMGYVKENMRKWCPNHQPISTIMGVEKLGFDAMKIEIEVVAHAGGAREG